MGRDFGLGSLGSLVMLCSKSLGRYNWDFEASTLGILDELTGASWGLDLSFFRRARERGLGKGEKEPYGRSLSRFTVGFWGDLP